MKPASLESKLAVIVPLAPQLTSSLPSGGLFAFSFTPVVGLTNTVLFNTDPGAAWNVLSNIPPPATNTPITVNDQAINAQRNYRVRFDP